MSRVIVIEVPDAQAEDDLRMAIEVAKGEGVTVAIVQWTSLVVGPGRS